MNFKLGHVMPWGRSFEEYRSMFSLSKHKSNKRILSCADGPTSFNTTLTELQSEDYDGRIQIVAYEFQKGGNQMLRIRKP